MKKIVFSFATALHHIRTHFFHTILSILGIVIGVAALVAILSLIDGMEQYAQEQITKTTDLKAVLIQPNLYKSVNDVQVRKDDYAYFTPARFDSLRASLRAPVGAYLYSRQNGEVTLKADGRKAGTLISAVTWPLHPDLTLLHGRTFTQAELIGRQPVAFINQRLAKQLVGKRPEQTAIGQQVTYQHLTLTIVGIAADKDARSGQLLMPLTLLPDSALRASPPMGVVEAGHVEDVPALKTQLETWLKANMPHQLADFSVITNELRVSQAAKGFMLFRLVMGLIVGISVLVGGIGVMNVLLISVTERTVEIGVRKALGAKKRDILWQFLSESITISTFGSMLGLMLGILSTLAFVPIISAVTNVPFQAAYTWNTLLIIVGVAMVIGILFGTYPAMRAARLDPVEAIRRE
ncbi:Macrolide export ATP-binding/permease protein macB [Fibrella aestuarina BUZ 2]|uniref:Macrolide export ATP-binding/permease protein macB n=1 Tax=Fibrella aestuarina BUZ 2 TaxID=1166018 RepID=I0K1V2_9BACT|nr:ABC transporter permease [Fibrella aestuarina]CCG98105.1 Macrolide export ATP-binding/permease protein macB [Fibrella aestuarina BUZ 2]